MRGPLRLATTDRIDSGLTAEWQELHRSSAGATPWQSPDFCSAAIAMNGGSNRPLILTCRTDDGTLAGVLALGIEHRRHGPFSIDTIRSLGPRRVDYSDPLIGDGYQSEVAAAMAGQLEALRKSGAAFDLRYLIHDGPIATALGHRFRAVGTLPIRSAQLTARSSWRDVVNSGHQRREIDRNWRRLSELADASFRWARDRNQATTFTQAFATLHSVQQQALGRISAFSTRAAAEGLSGLLEKWVPQGKADIGLLEIGGDTAAGYILFHRESTTWAWRTCFEASHSRLGPGMLALSAAIDRAIELGSSRYDFGFGDEPYKHQWSQIDSAAVRVTAAPPPYRSLPYRLINRIASLSAPE